MTIYSAFSIPTLGMMGQSYALATIGNNIANVTTGGFKRTDTNFSTLLSQTVDHQSDIGGMKPKDLFQITQQGNMVISNRDLDLAINGQGFFVLNSDISGGGETYYGRDGSFEMATVNDISVTGNGGSTITTKDGYLVDKNGYYLQGWTADPATGLFTSTSLSSLRVDPYAFASAGQATTTAALELNLPAMDSPGLPQVTSIELLGTVEAGDIYSVTVEGTQVDYTVQATDITLNDIRTGLIAAVNADPTVSSLAAASASPTDNKILVTGNTQGVSLSVTGSSANGGGNVAVDNQTTSLTVENATLPDTEYYNIEVFDSNGNARSVRLDFAKTATNTWDLSATVGKTPIAQVDTVTLAGTIEAGDTYSVAVDGVTFTHAVTATDTLTTIRDSLIATINSSTGIAVTAVASGTNAITLTANAAGTSFVATSTTVNRLPSSQIDDVALTGTYAAGDTISVDIDGAGAIAAVIYTVVDNDLTVDGIGGAAISGGSTTAYDNIATKIAAAINGDAPTAAVVSAASTGGGAGVVKLTAASAGTAFTQVASATASPTGTATPSTATANVAAASQVDNATLTGVYVAGDTISVDIDGGGAIAAVVYMVTANDLTVDGIGGAGVAGNSVEAYNNITTSIAAALNADIPTAAVVTAAATGAGSGIISMTAVTPGTPIAQITSTTFTAGTGATTVTTPTPNVVAVAQIDNATLTSEYAAGDVVSVNINGIGAVLYTVAPNDLTANGDGTGGGVAGNSAAAYNNITTNIAAAIAADAPSAALVTAAAPGGGGGIVTLTATTAGTAFTQASSAARTATGLVTATTPTPNVAALTDNAATLANTVANVPASDTITTAISTLTFNEDGSIATPDPASVNLVLTFPPSGSYPTGTATMDLDISGLDQFAGSFQPFGYTNNGYAAANATSIKFDSSGQVIASFDNSTFRAVYKIPLAQFANANGLQEYGGNVYQETADSGSARVVDVDKSGYASFLPNTHELSNVDLAGEFTRMMMTQTAYNSSATVFKTVDEMITAARDLKR
jgi:flagellar hook-basal body protein